MEKSSLETIAHWTLPVLTAVCLFGISETRADSLAQSDFGSGFTDGNLVGQGGWLQYQTQITKPILVDDGEAILAPVVANDQDAFLGFPSKIIQPASGTTFLYFAFDFSVASAPADNASYSIALNTFTDGTTSNNFQNSRIVVKDNGSSTGFLLGGKVNGQAGYPLVFGSATLNYNQSYTLLAEIALVSGNANDYINFYVNPTSADLSGQTPYAVSSYTSGSVTDPEYGAILLSQFGSGSLTAANIGVSKIIVATTAGEAYGFVAIPEPQTYAMLLGGLGVAVLVFRRRRS